MVDLNKVTIGVLCGIAGGVVAGVGARISMRGVALAANIPPSFSIGGTLAILVFGAILGIPFGLLFVAVRPRLPGSRWRGLIFGVVLVLVFVVPPFLLIRPEGELALLPPLTGLSLFAPLPIIYGVVTQAAAERLERKYQPADRRSVRAVWFALFGLALIVGLIGYSSYFESSPFPSAVEKALREIGVPFRASRGVNTGILITFAIAYFGTCALIFWRGSRTRMATFAALALLAFAGAFFNRNGILGGIMTGLPAARLLVALVQAVALGSMVLLFFLFPDGRFAPRWMRPLAGVGFAWSLLWFLRPLPGSRLDPETWPELLRLMVVVGFFAAGVLAQVYRYRRVSTPQQRRQTKWAVAGISTAVLGFALIGGSLMLIPEFEVTRPSGVSAFFVFSIYLLPWLLVPLSIAISMRRCRLWETDMFFEEERPGHPAEFRP